ncbi:hypothetical protein [Mesorhizobium sp.]|uniref:hypothetical protein n=1 Tax=Mesorhizobium sp. TaxID=1871066 RepID=UPI000FE5B415|nr:hypothetical protein [Mesorhizobium sp.]RWB67594.1 MAG: hypothetical protein EOQ49_25065 [Mesorhizobium sp.]
MARIAFLSDHGAKVEGPPANWRPRALTIKEKLEIVVRQGGREPGGARLLPLEGLAFDHVPALQRRRWCAETGDTIPASCSLDHIQALNNPTHAEKTAKSDIPEIAKTKRLEERRSGDSKPKRKWPTRKFPSRKDARKVPW